MLHFCQCAHVVPGPYPQLRVHDIGFSSIACRNLTKVCVSIPDPNPNPTPNPCIASKCPEMTKTLNAPLSLCTTMEAL